MPNAPSFFVCKNWKLSIDLKSMAREKIEIILRLILRGGGKIYNIF